MTRDSRARWLALATTALVVGLAALFAALRNLPATPAPSPPAASADSSQSARGRAAFERLNCTLCHAVAGRGNLRHPLDGVGGRLDRAQLRDWTLGSGPAEASLPEDLLRLKRSHARDPDVEALLDYLQQLR